MQTKAVTQLRRCSFPVSVCSLSLVHKVKTCGMYVHAGNDLLLWLFIVLVFCVRRYTTT